MSDVRTGAEHVACAETHNMRPRDETRSGHTSTQPESRELGELGATLRHDTGSTRGIVRMIHAESASPNSSISPVGEGKAPSLEHPVRTGCRVRQGGGLDLGFVHWARQIVRRSFN